MTEISIYDTIPSGIKIKKGGYLTMWNAQEFANVLERHPDGGTLWTRTHRMVRYVRIFRRTGIIMAVMTEKWLWGGTNKVELFVRTLAGAEVAEFPKAEKTPEFMKTLLESPILNLVDAAFLPDVKQFISTSDDTRLTTW